MVLEVKEVTDADMAFGPRNLEELLPDYKSVPAEFKDWNNQTKWNRLFSGIFFGSDEIKENSLFLFPKPGVDGEKAFRMIRSIMGSFKPKHEHKEAGCAYLFSNFFDDYAMIKPITSGKQTSEARRLYYIALDEGEDVKTAIATLENMSGAKDRKEGL